MNWKKKTFEELTKHELYHLLQQRVEVFVVEQECPYPEVDGRDVDCLHIWGEVDGEMAVYCRIVPPEKDGEPYAIGRVLVRKPYRGRGYARKIMNYAIRILTEEWNVKQIGLHGQEHLRHFYGSFGFEEVSEVYLEDGIPHVDMCMHMK